MFNIFQHNHIFDCNFIAHLGGIILYIFMGYALLLLTLQETHLVTAWMSFKPECEIRPINWWMTIATTVSWPDGTSHIRPISRDIPWYLTDIHVYTVHHGFFQDLPMKISSSSIPSGAMRYAALGLDVISSIRGRNQWFHRLSRSPRWGSPAYTWLSGLKKHHEWWQIDIIWLVVWNMKFMTFHMLGMSSSQLTHIFQRGWNHQPVMNIYIYSIYIYIYSIYIYIVVNNWLWLCILIAVYRTWNDDVSFFTSDTLQVSFKLSIHIVSTLLLLRTVYLYLYLYLYLCIFMYIYI